MRRLRSILLASLLALLAAYAPADAGGPGELISTTSLDIDADGRPETIEIVMTKGRRWKDAETWCGNGEKWEGRFEIRTIKNGNILWSGALNALIPDGGAASQDLTFWTPKFALVTGDCAGDGRPCFNLGQYATCNGNDYRLFTVRPNGEVLPLPSDTPELFLADSKSNSTRKIKMNKGSVSWTFYDNAEGKSVTARLKWNGERFVEER